ncbi:MAG: hypothetical protein U0P81_10880 [Holophagaceae bacterium]
MTPHPHHLLRLALAGAGDIEEWRLGDPARAAALGYPRRYPAPVLDDRGIVFLDVVVEDGSGDLVCHEANGPNAVGSDALTGDSRLRAANEADQAASRLAGLAEPAVTLHAHQHWRSFRTGGEFFPRVDDFAQALAARLPERTVRLRGAHEALGDEGIAVVFGDVPRVAADLELDEGSGDFRYRGRPVAFLGNPNLATELARLGRLPLRTGGLPLPARRAFHAWRLLDTLRDKGLQQDLLAGTGLRPLRWFEAWSREEALAKAREALASGPVVLKPNAASGGAGVHAVVASMTDGEILARVDAVLADCAAKYGANAEATAYPVRGFEFVRSTGYPMASGGHLWDLRIAVQFEPGEALAYPVSLRLAPEPFEPDAFHRDRDQWISNVSGRQVTLLKSGMDEAVLRAVGLAPGRLEAALEGCVRWTLKAWDAAARGGGPGGGVFEDRAEAEDPGFYPREAFRP